MLGQAAPWLDGILFKKFKQAFGGRVRFIVSGGAPLATHIEEYLSVALCCPVFQVYPGAHARALSGLPRLAPHSCGKPHLGGVHGVLLLLLPLRCWAGF